MPRLVINYNSRPNIKPFHSACAVGVEQVNGGRRKGVNTNMEQQFREAARLNDMRTAEIRTFETGATRDTNEGKLDFEGFLSPDVIEAYAQYMHRCRIQSDGKLRDSDNWQKGIPKEEYMKSAWRHFFAWWRGHRKGKVNMDDLCGVMFNVMGYCHERLKTERP